MEKRTVKIFWTGGWDSTFRVLQLVDQEKIIEPYYIIDTNRPSSLAEIKALNMLTEMIKDHFPGGKQYLQEVKTISIHNIEKNQEISNSWKKLRSQDYLGSQYDWLARFAIQYDINGIEMAVQYRPGGLVEKFLRNNMEEYEGSASLTETANKDLQNIFKYFTFPLLTWTKLDMEAFSRDKGWDKIMDATWFCHTPVGNQPCGLCNPCIFVIEEGMKKRLSSISLLRYKLRFLYKTMASFRKGASKIYRKAI